MQHPTDCREDSDKDLVEGCQQEIPYVTKSFEQLVRRYQPVVLSTCHKYLGNREDAEEACQDVFLQVFHSLPNFEFKSAFRTWLFRVVANACTDRHRRDKRERTLRVQYVAEAMEPVTFDVAQAGQEFGRLDGPVGQALDSLGEADRQILVLRHVGELSIRELSEVIGVGESATKMRLYRAEARLREAYRHVEQATARTP